MRRGGALAARHCRRPSSSFPSTLRNAPARLALAHSRKCTMRLALRAAAPLLSTAAAAAAAATAAALWPATAQCSAGAAPPTPAEFVDASRQGLTATVVKTARSCEADRAAALLGAVDSRQCAPRSQWIT